jgi:hypothetical protein
MTGGGGNVEVVKRVYALVAEYLEGRTDSIDEEIARLISPALVLTPSSALSSGSIGPYRGIEGFFEWLEGVRSQWASFEMQAVRFAEAPPDRVVMLGRNVASRSGGQGYAVSVGHLWTLDGGAVVAITAYESQAQALEEAGLSE